MPRRRPISRSTAAVLWLVPAAGLACMAVLAILAPRDLDPALFLSLLTWIGAFGFVGAFVAVRVSGNVVGWLLWASSLCAAIAFCGSDYAGYSIEHAGGTFPATVAVAWLSSWMFIPAIGITLIYIPLLFPDGRLLSRRWRPVAVFGGFAIGSAALVAFGPVLSNVDDLPNPLAIPALAPLIAVVGFPPGPLMVATILVSLASQVPRYRRGDSVERHQLRWVGFVLVIVFLVFGFGPDLLSFISLALLPIGIGIAILRFRLYEIDRIISRTVSYAVLTAILGAAFVALVVVIQAAIEPVLPHSSVAVVISTLAVALLFQPLRRRIQAMTDRRFNRSRYDAQRTIDGLAARVRSQSDLRQLRRDILATADDAVHPTTVAIWLR